MKKEKSFRVFVIYALLLQFAILISQQSLIINSTSSTIPNYNTRDATVQVLVSYTDTYASESQDAAYAGTGTIIAEHEDMVYVLTAKHVCSPNPFSIFYLGMTQNIEIQDIDGESHYGEIALLSPNEDLCIVKYFISEPGTYGIAKFAPKPAAIDSSVSMYAAPSGFYVPSAITKFTGTFSGESLLWGGQVSVYTIPATGGASGASITNNRGEIVGVLHSVLIDFHHISLSSTHGSIISFIEDLELQEGIMILD
jgi:hypothetical protein